MVVRGIMTVEDEAAFLANCAKGYCLRKTLKSRTCSRIEKRQLCYLKYIKTLNKGIEKRMVTNELWETLKEECWLKYTGSKPVVGQKHSNWREVCVYYKTRTEQEKRILEDKWSTDLWLNEHIDTAHKESRAQSPKDKLDVNNVLLLGRLWHTLIDSNVDPLTMRPLTPEAKDALFKDIDERYEKLQHGVIQ